MIPVVPSDDIDRRLSAIWAELLGRDSIAPEQTFTALGGDSVAATICLIRVRAEFGVELPYSSLYDERATVARVADDIRRASHQRRGPAP